ncbi:hypothetical protein AMJ85_11605 [candidate division BRC1 bacterium SM23_51]|nr:MAG: hypothetical protein AMJ85_11605 [candidate division BRC1 bacterium SM23_51]
MGITAAVTRVVCDTATGDQDITTDDLGGLTPKAVFFVASRTITDGTIRTHAGIGIGAATAADEQWAMAIDAEDAQATTDVHRRAMTDECVLFLQDGNNVVDGEANFKAFVENGCTITWGDACSSAWLLTAVFFAGTDLSAKAGVEATCPTENNTLDVNSVGFEPDVVFTGSNGDTIDDSNSSANGLSHGVVTNTDPIVQVCWATSSDNGEAASLLTAEIMDHYGVMQVYNEAHMMTAVQLTSPRL